MEEVPRAESVRMAMTTLTRALDSSRAEQEQWQAEQKVLLQKIAGLEKTNRQHGVTEANMARRIRMLEHALQQRSGTAAAAGAPAEGVSLTGDANDEQAGRTAPLEPLFPPSLNDTISSDRSSSTEPSAEWLETISLRCHLDCVTSVVFHHSEPLLCSASQDATLKLWNLSSLAKSGSRDTELDACFTLRGHTGAVNMCHFCKDGTQIVSCSDDTTIRLWKVPPTDPGALYQAFGRSVLHLEKTLSGHSGAVRVALPHPTSDTILSASVDRTVRLWGADATQCFVPERSAGRVPTSAAFNTAHGSALIGYESGEVIVLDTEKVTESQVMGKESANPVLQVVCHDTLPLAIAAHGDGSIVCFDLRSGTEAQRISGAHAGAVRSLDIDSSGLALVSGGDDCEVRIWDIGKWTQLESHCCHVGRGVRCGVLDTVFHPDKCLLASAGADGIIQIFHQDS